MLHLQLGAKVKTISKRFFSCTCMPRDSNQEESFNPHNPNPIFSAGTVSPFTPVPDHIVKPKYYTTGQAKFHNKIQLVKTEEEVVAMREVCALARKTLNYARNLVRVGITTDEIDRAVFEFIVSHNAFPSTLNYNHFPKSVCTSVNNVIVHGIPDDRALMNGDIINIDVTVYLNGYHGDCNETIFVGEGHTEQVKQFVEVTRQSLYNAIQVCGPGVYINKIGETIENTVKPFGYAILEEFTGHGVGKHFHSYPTVNHYKTKRIEAGPIQMFKPGMTFTIEPVINMSSKRWRMWKDKWTIVTANGDMSATWEHTLMITEEGVEVLTANEGEQRFYTLEHNVNN